MAVGALVSEEIPVGQYRKAGGATGGYCAIGSCLTATPPMTAMNRATGAITVMSVGEIQQVAEPTVVYDYPANRFVAEFVGKVPWAHLDIAGTAYGKKGGAYTTKGATGAPARLLVEFLIGRSA